MKKILPVLFVALLLTGCSLVKKEAQNIVENKNNEDQNKAAQNNNEIQNNITEPAVNKEIDDIKTSEPIIKTSEPAAIDTKDWQTYKNEKYGFTMQYPKDWAVKEAIADCSEIMGAPDTFYYLRFTDSEEKFFLRFDFRDKGDKFDPWCRTGIGAGGEQAGGKIKIAEVEVMKNYLVYKNAVQEVFYADFNSIQKGELTKAFIIGPLKIMSNLFAQDAYENGFDLRNSEVEKIADKILESFEFTN